MAYILHAADCITHTDEENVHNHPYNSRVQFPLFNPPGVILFIVLNEKE